MKVTIAVLASIIACVSVNAAAGAQKGPTFDITVNDPSLPNGVGSLGLEGEYERELVDNMSAGIKYDYNSYRGKPKSIWVSTRAELDEGLDLVAKAEYDMGSKATVIEARLEKGDDSISMDFNTGDNEAGPVKISKTLDMSGRRVTLKPEFNVKDRTGELVINTEVDGEATIAELTLNQADESATLEVSHKVDDSNIVSPKVNLKTGDISVRLNRRLDNGGDLEVTADRKNVDWEFQENAWTVKGNIPLEDAGSSSISFKRSINLS